MPIRYPVLFLDFDGTLVNFGASMQHALQASCEAHGIAFTTEVHQQYTAINSACWYDYERGLLSADAMKIERSRRFLAAMKLDTDPAKFNEVYLRELGSKAELLPGVADAIAQLRDLGCRLCLITNGLSQVQRARLTHVPFAHEFEAIVISEEIGESKPAPAYFDHALHAMGNPMREDVLVVGDSLSADIAGGVASDMDTCWVYGTQTMPDFGSASFSPTYRTETVSGVVAIAAGRNRAVG